MRVTPLDIIQKAFRPARRGGYDPDDVGAFLDEVRETLEDLLQENADLKGRLSELETELARLRAAEAEIKDTLLLARRCAEDLERSARREVDLQLGEARLEAQQILSAAHDEHRALLREVARLRGVRHHVLASTRALLESFGRQLDDLEREFGDAT